MSLLIDQITSWVERNIGDFHNKRLASLDKLKLKRILERKNPYLFKAKHIQTAEELVRTFLDSHLSSQEETIFGDFLEGLAIFVNKQIFNGWKSSSEGIDLEFDSDNIRFLVSIKSGPNWGNSSQINKMKDNFIKARRILRTSNSRINITAVNGCCYGKDSKPDKDGYLKLCGQRFWGFISGDDELYTKIIVPLGYKAKEKNDAFLAEYARVINNFTAEFYQGFCDDGQIDWDKLVKFNSANR